MCQNGLMTVKCTCIAQDMWAQWRPFFLLIVVTRLLTRIHFPFLQNSKGGVEVAVKCFYRRRDLPSQLLALADQHARKSVCLTDRYVTRVRDDGVMFNVNKRTVALPAHLTPQSILCGRKNRNVTFCFVF